MAPVVPGVAWLLLGERELLAPQGPRDGGTQLKLPFPSRGCLESARAIQSRSC